MKLKSHGNASLSDEDAEQAKEDFAAQGLYTGPAIGGALTQIIANLLEISPDKESAMQMLSACIHNASVNVADKKATHYAGHEIH
jgi:hypothetical protein